MPRATLLLAMLVPLGASERWQMRGSVENHAVVYAHQSDVPPARAANETVLRVETSLRLGGGWRWHAALDASHATAGQTTREFSWFDETEQRPALAVRQLMLRYARGPFRLELGKQPLEWGGLDVLSPAGRIAPRDLMNPPEAGRLGVWAIRGVADTGRHRLEAAWLPWFTPSRVPLTGQRWIAPAVSSSFFTPRYLGRRLPAGPQYGARYTWVRPRYEWHAIAFDGYQPVPSLVTRFQFLNRTLDYRLVYPRHRLVGGGITIPWRGWLLKSEITETSPRHVWSGVVSAEAVRGRWQGGGGWYFTREPGVPSAPYASGYVGRLAWTPRPRHTVGVEAGLQENGRALASRFLYTRTWPGGWRARAGYVWIHGAASQWIARYGVNSHALLSFGWMF